MMGRKWTEKQRAEQSRKIKAAWAAKRKAARPWWRRLLGL